MKIQFIGLSLLLGLGSNLLTAQDSLLSIEDCFNPKLYPTSLKAVQWIPNSHKFSQVKGEALVATDPYSKKDDTIFTLSKLNASLAVDNASLKAIPMVTWKDYNSLWFIAGNKMFVYTLSSQTSILKRQLPESNDAMEISPESMNVAAVVKDNLEIISAYGRKKITEDGGSGIVYGQAVHRNEFGINGGLFWNKDGTKLAFYRMDEKRVTDYPIYNLSTRPASDYKIKYPMAGDSSHTVTVGIYNTYTEELKYLNTEGPYDQYLTNITWSPDGLYVYIAWVNREQNWMQLRKYNASTGELEKVLLDEKHEKYVEPEHGPIFLPESNSDFIWFSERDGFDHMYLYQGGKLNRQLTTGNWEVTKFIGFDKEANGFYFEGTKESPLERHVYYLKLKDKEPRYKKITSGAGTHNVSLNNFSGLYMDMMTSRKEPRKYTVYKTDGTIINEIFKSPNPLESFSLGEIKIEPILANGVALYTRTFLPYDFDVNKKYPVVVYVYGGPHAQMITESWLGGANLWFHYMAQNGYIVYTVDNRGSSHKGLQFENAVHRQLGTVEMSDQIAALDYLKKFPYVDSNRIGIHGWSFGGFMTTSLMTRTPGIYKVGVAGGPVIDWKYYEIMYTERYMDKPQENPEGYAAASLLKYAGNLQGRLLMIHGTDDDVVVWQHSMLYIKEMVKNRNANLDYYVYPGHKHNVIGPDRVHLYKKISQYFFDYL
ncbi:MAG: DPP IV N-terminal domain-containing protein [Bacteroidetes bacterium]|nr:DPP IV N-terminal domain-containing protein [Bacteroidota bacterium]